MADIDYAFVAEFARVEPNGTLTAIGSSWTFLEAETIPTAHRMAIAGRVKAHVDEGTVPVKVRLQGPDRSFELSAEADLIRPPESKPYGGGFVGLLFAIDLQLLIPQTGLYEVFIELPAEQKTRRLAFEVVTPSE